MAGPFRPIAAFRKRLVDDAAFQAYVGSDADIPNGARVYPQLLIDVSEPVYPCVTLFQVGGTLVRWAPRTNENGMMLVQFYSTVDMRDTMEMYEIATQLLHDQKTALSIADLCVHDVQEVWSNSPIFLKDTGAWQLSARYSYRASIMT